MAVVAVNGGQNLSVFGDNEAKTAYRLSCGDKVIFFVARETCNPRFYCIFVLKTSSDHCRLLEPRFVGLFMF